MYKISMDKARKPREANKTYVKDYFKLYLRLDKRVKKLSSVHKAII